MSKHIGHDHERASRFHIVDIDAAKHIIAIEYERTAWLSGCELTETLSCTEFLEQLAAGRYEIRPAG